MKAPEPVVTIIRPQLTPEEYERRMEIIKKSVSDFWLAVERRKQNARVQELQVHV